MNRGSERRFVLKGIHRILGAQSQIDPIAIQGSQRQVLVAIPVRVQGDNHHAVGLLVGRILECLVNGGKCSGLVVQLRNISWLSWM